MDYVANLVASLKSEPLARGPRQIPVRLAVGTAIDDPDRDGPAFVEEVDLGSAVKGAVSYSKSRFAQRLPTRGFVSIKPGPVPRCLSAAINP